MAKKSLQLKVCGMMELENLQMVAALHPDYIGFIFYDQSPRYAGDSLTAEAAKGLPSGIAKVGVFVNSTTAFITGKVKEYQLNLVQLHGGETAEQCQQLREKGLKVIKAFAMDNAFDFNRLIPYKPFVDYFLFDTKGKSFGGNGQLFDWRILEAYDQEIPFFLSGGIALEHLEAIGALAGMNMHALDVNSKFEVYPGFKDITKLQQLKKQLVEKEI